MSRPSRNQIAKAAVELMNSGISSSKLSRQLAAYLLSEGRTSELSPLMRDIIKLRSQQGIIEATAVSARELSQQVQRDLMKLAASGHNNYKQVILNQERDPALLGGVRLSSIDSELDLSLASQLNGLTKSINNVNK